MIGRRTTPNLKLFLVGLLVYFLVACEVDSLDPDGPVTFDGKRIQLIVNFAAGGSSDQFARTLAPYLTKYLPGQPSVVIVNKTGAGGLLAATYVYGATRPDGLVLCICKGTTMRWGPSRTFPIDVKRFSIVGSAQFNAVLVVGGSLNVSTVEELANTDGKLFMATNSPVAPNPMRTKMLLSQLGDVDFKAIGGFTTSQATMSSVRQGETALSTLTAGVYIGDRDELRETGEALGLLQFGFVNEDGQVRRSRNIDLTTYREVWLSLPDSARESNEYQLAVAYDYAARASTIFALAPDTPESIEKVWDAALAAALADPEFSADRERQQTDEITFAGRAATLEVIDEIRRRFDDPDVISALEHYAPALRK